MVYRETEFFFRWPAFSRLFFSGSVQSAIYPFLSHWTERDSAFAPRFVVFAILETATAISFQEVSVSEA